MDEVDVEDYYNIQGPRVGSSARACDVLRALLLADAKRGELEGNSGGLFCSICGHFPSQ